METEHTRLQVLGSHEIDEVLEHNFHGHLGCFNRRESYVLPVTYIRDGDFIYSHSRPGQKIEMMRANPKVYLQVEEIQSLFHWRSVIVWGRFEELEGLEAAAGLRLLFRKYAELQRERGLTPLELEISATLSDSIIYRIRIERTSGRAEGHNAPRRQFEKSSAST